MGEAEFTREHDRRLRRARVIARLSMRTYQRELKGYSARDLQSELQSAFYLTERLRQGIQSKTDEKQALLLSHIQLKLELIALGAATLLDIPAPSTKCSN